MNATITSQNKIDYLLIESQGRLQTKADLFKHSQKIYHEIAQHNIQKILVDEPDIHFPLGLFNYYDLVMHYIKDFPPEIRFLKIAIVISIEYKEVATFWETVCVNHGLQFFAFTSFQEAIDWLLD